VRVGVRARLSWVSQSFRSVFLQMDDNGAMASVAFRMRMKTGAYFLNPKNILGTMKTNTLSFAVAISERGEMGRSRRNSCRDVKRKETEGGMRRGRERNTTTKRSSVGELHTAAGKEHGDIPLAPQQLFEPSIPCGRLGVVGYDPGNGNAGGVPWSGSILPKKIYASSVGA